MRGYLTSTAGGWAYLLGLGSNLRHHRHGPPPRVLKAAIVALEEAGIVVVAAAPVIASVPLGPSRRLYANGAALVRTPLDPPALLATLKTIERRFGRRARGRRWAARVLDLDIVLWEGGRWASPGLTVPHREFRQRGFVLGPAASLAPRWRDPVSGMHIAALDARLTRRRALPKREGPDGGP